KDAELLTVRTEGQGVVQDVDRRVDAARQHRPSGEEERRDEQSGRRLSRERRDEAVRESERKRRGRPVHRQGANDQKNHRVPYGVRRRRVARATAAKTPTAPAAR